MTGRRTLSRALWLALACLVLAPVAGAQRTSYQEDFGNSGGWTWGAGDQIVDAGGSPGAYLRTTFLDTFAPQPRTTIGVVSPFVGNYRQRRVLAIGIDLQTFDVDFSAEGRPLTLMLVDDQDTPADVTDDCSAYLLGDENVPLPGEGWKEYLFGVPSDSPTLPPGWRILEEHCQAQDPNALWQTIVTGVDQLKFFYGDPTFFFIFQVWDVGLDSPRILLRE